MFQSPTSAVCAVEPAARGRAQPGQPVELVDVVRVVGLAAVGDVERPDAHPAAGGADRAGLGGRGVAPPGHVGEADLDVLEADARQQRDAVPLVEPGDGDVVAEGLQAHQRQLVLAGLGLLQREHVDVVSLHERLDAVDAGAEGVDVPGRDAHPPTLRKAVRARMPWGEEGFAQETLYRSGPRGGSSSARTCLGNSCKPCSTLSDADQITSGAAQDSEMACATSPIRREEPTCSAVDSGRSPSAPQHSSARPSPHRHWPPRTRRSRRSRSSTPPPSRTPTSSTSSTVTSPSPTPASSRATTTGWSTAPRRPWRTVSSSTPSAAPTTSGRPRRSAT